MSIVYCDYCNHSAPRNEWDGIFTANGEDMCSQCESDGMELSTMEYDDILVPALFQEWNN